MNELSVIFSGAQGVGKTTLSKKWAEKHNVPFECVSTTDLMPFGISSHLDIIKMSVSNPEAAIHFQTDLISARSNMFKKLHDSEQPFISDRGVVDSYIYYTLHNSMFDTLQSTNTLKALTFNSIRDIDCTVIVNSASDEVDDNNIRLTSPDYQKVIGFNIWRTTLDMYYGNYGHPEHEFNIQHTGVALKMLIFRGGIKGKAFITINESEGMRTTEERIKILEEALKLFKAVSFN